MAIDIADGFQEVGLEGTVGTIECGACADIHDALLAYLVVNINHHGIDAIHGDELVVIGLQISRGEPDGASYLFAVDYLSTEAVIRNNDQVVSTGSTLYPRGLILGYVVDAGLDGTGVAKYAIIEPAADFDLLEQVFIITNYVNE